MPDLEDIKNAMMLREDPIARDIGKSMMRENNFERDGSGIDLPKHKGLAYGNV
jgi:hypothetical protein